MTNRQTFVGENDLFSPHLRFNVGDVGKKYTAPCARARNCLFLLLEKLGCCSLYKRDRRESVRETHDDRSTDLGIYGSLLHGGCVYKTPTPNSSNTALREG